MRASNPLEERLIALIEPAAEELGYRLVRVRVSGNRRKRLQIMAERVSDGQMEIEDCTRLSRVTSALLDANDPIQDQYDLEVSSPGIDRPLMRIEDFQRFAGHTAKLETTAMIDGQKRFKGDIAGVEGDTIKLATERGEMTFKFSALHDARLVLTDKLIEEDLRRAKAAQRETPPPLAGEVRAKRAEGVREASNAGASPLSHASRDSSPAGGGTGKTKRKSS